MICSDVLKSGRPGWNTRRRARPAPPGSERPGTRHRGRRGCSDARAQMLNHWSESKDRLLACLARNPKYRSIGRGTAEPLGSGDRCTPLPSDSSRQVPRIRHTSPRWRDRRRPSCNLPLSEPAFEPFPDERAQRLLGLHGDSPHSTECGRLAQMAKAKPEKGAESRSPAGTTRVLPMQSGR
jgi:hypothetical protein